MGMLLSLAWREGVEAMVLVFLTATSDTVPGYNAKPAPTETKQVAPAPMQVSWESDGRLFL